MSRAATLVIARDGPDGVETIMGRRPPGGVFGGVWVFPGGSIDPADDAAAHAEDDCWRLAALRETAEEVGIWLTDPPGLEAPPSMDQDVHALLREAGGRFATDRLVYLSNWVTPRFVPRRFDTRFFLVRAPSVDPGPVSDEFEEARWIAVAEALDGFTQGEFPLIFPTLKHLEYFSGFSTSDDIVREASSLNAIPKIEPRPMERGDDLRVAGDPRFESR